MSKSEELDEEAPPSTLFVFWPYDSMPQQEEVRHNLEGLARPSGKEPEGALLWADLFALEEHRWPAMIWPLLSSELDLDAELDQVAWGSDEERAKAEGARWLLGITLALDDQHPQSSYHLQLRLAAAAAPETPALFDACSMNMRSGTALERLTSTKVPPRTRELFTIHAVQSPSDDDDCWLHTHGLGRAELPDLELLGLPEELCSAGGHLLNGVADLFAGSAIPAPGESFFVGHGLELAWLPWSEGIAGYSGELGGRDDRSSSDEDHGGHRVILFSAAELAERRPPLELLRRLDQDDGVLYVSKRETERMSLLARERWPVFGMLQARHKADEDFTFLVKLGYEIDGGSQDEREHLWFEVSGIAPDLVTAKLINRPLQVAALKEGDEGQHELERLTDWTIFSPFGAFDPETAELLWEAARPEA